MYQKKIIKIIDPHVHFWDLSLGRNHWLSGRSDLLGSLAPINKNYLKQEYLLDSQEFDVEKIIHVEAASKIFSKSEVEWLDKLYDSDSFLGGIVAGVDFLDPRLEEALEFYGNNKRVKGVRQLLNWSENPKYTAADRSDDLTNQQWIKNFSLLKKYHLSFDMQICPEQMNGAIALAELYSDIEIIIDHAGMPIAEYLHVWKKGIARLSSCKNVYIKLSGFGMFDHHWRKESVIMYIEYIINCFGANRCMFASNFPVDKLYRSYNALMQSYIQIAQECFHQDINKLFYENAKIIYKL